MKINRLLIVGILLLIPLLGLSAMAFCPTAVSWDNSSAKVVTSQGYTFDEQGGADYYWVNITDPTSSLVYSDSILYNISTACGNTSSYVLDSTGVWTIFVGNDTIESNNASDTITVDDGNINWVVNGSVAENNTYQDYNWDTLGVFAPTIVIDNPSSVEVVNTTIGQSGYETFWIDQRGTWTAYLFDDVMNLLDSDTTVISEQYTFTATWDNDTGYTGYEQGIHYSDTTSYGDLCDIVISAPNASTTLFNIDCMTSNTMSFTPDSTGIWNATVEVWYGDISSWEDGPLGDITITNTPLPGPTPTPGPACPETPYGTASASSTAYGDPSWAFDGSINGNTWISGIFAFPDWLQMDYGSGSTNYIDAYGVGEYPGLEEWGPTNWTLAGSNDEAAWTTIDTRIGEPQLSGWRNYTVASPGNYRYYRITIPDMPGETSVTEIDELALMTCGAPTPTTTTTRNPCISDINSWTQCKANDIGSLIYLGVLLSTASVVLYIIWMFIQSRE